MAGKHAPAAQRFLRHVTVLGPNDCWPWTGGMAHGGYGQFRGHNGELIRAHRFAWEEVNGPVPPGRHLLHDCDNPPCCNPKHLYPGSHRDNMLDANNKGRRRFGEHHGMAKLRPHDITAIRSDPRLHRVIASQYGLSRQHVSAIKTRKIWRNVP